MVAQVVLRGYEEKNPGAWEGMDQQQEQWDCLRRRLARRPEVKRLSITNLCQAYEETTHMWTGCD
jgi:hypothetical protein